jgi:hypothetical protein
MAHQTRTIEVDFKDTWFRKINMIFNGFNSSRFIRLNPNPSVGERARTRNKISFTKNK